MESKSIFWDILNYIIIEEVYLIKDLSNLLREIKLYMIYDKL